MTVDGRDVNGSLLNSTPKSYLTLSAAPTVAQPSDDDRSAALRVPDEAAVRDERDPYIIPELELRALWGDR